jgi:hypothetical protein
MEWLRTEWETFFTDEQSDTFWTRKKQLWEKQKGEIVQIKGNGKIYERTAYDEHTQFRYLLHLSYLIKQNEQFHLEEQVIPYELLTKNGDIIKHSPLQIDQQESEQKLKWPGTEEQRQLDFTYDRRAAVRYAERWWNSYNPAYRRFSNDCTNYISQCLRAGGAPMWGSPNRDTGWWYTSDSWSFSWAVAHSMRWYLSGAEQGLKGKEVESPQELTYGDVICYDFNGDGRWDHTTIVTGKDQFGMPLVNAHTDNSRHRYWSYEDSAAWTENIEYKFFRIGDA